METTTYTTTIIKADNGKYLTQKECDPLGRVITADQIFLAATDSVDNWKEIEEEEKAALEQEIEVAQLALEAESRAVAEDEADATEGAAGDETEQRAVAD